MNIKLILFLMILTLAALFLLLMIYRPRELKRESLEASYMEALKNYRLSNNQQNLEKLKEVATKYGNMINLSKEDMNLKMNDDIEIYSRN